MKNGSASFEMWENRTNLRSAGLTLLRGIFLGLVLLSPFIVGAPYKFRNEIWMIVLGAVLGFLFAVLWWVSGMRSEGAHKLLTAVVSFFLAVTLLDLVARPFVPPVPFSIVDWPPMPLVKRHLPNMHMSGNIYGELAVPPARAGEREYRKVTFTTDRFGFRNDRAVEAPIDVIALGDSYAAAYDTTQDKMWSVLLSKQSGVHVYNMAVGGDGPWTEYTNLTLELDHLTVRLRGTVVLWMLFTGNDLVDPCHQLFSKGALPWRRGLRGLTRRTVTGIKTLRERSPLGAGLNRLINGYPEVDETTPRKFLDGRNVLFLRKYAEQAALGSASVRVYSNFGCIKQTISAMRRFAEQKNLTVAIIVAPPKEEVYSWVLQGRQPWSAAPRSGFASAISDIAREAHIPFLDLRPFLDAASLRVFRQSGKLLYWRDDTHWNDEGNTEVAKVLYEFYQSLSR